MSETYKKLLDTWRAAASTTREAQKNLKEKFDLFLQGRGPEPSKAEVEDLQRLRAVENAKLAEASDYLSQSSRRGMRLKDGSEKPK